MPPPTYNTGFGCFPLPGSASTLCDFVPGLPVQLPLSPTWVPATLPFQALRLGDTAFAAVPGEPTTELGLALKQLGPARGFARGFVLGLANDHGGYFTTQAEYASGSYEARATIYGPGTGAVVLASAAAALDDLP
jgi:hypothetical protein